MKLVIVESPTKAKIIQKFLSKGFTVKSSFGHVRDLPKNVLGVDVEHNFQPKYVIPPKARKTITELKKAAAKKEVILATDEDREGEAIAWHLAQALKLDPNKTDRIVFHEITKSAIENALGNPRQIDENLVDAQQARRILDRIVGYKLSPLLWKKIRRGLSAGRVQSVAVRMIVEREREIEAFVPVEYWEIFVEVTKIPSLRGDPIISGRRGNPGEIATLSSFARNDFIVKLMEIDGEKATLSQKDQVDPVVDDLKKAQYSVEKVD